MNTQTSDGIAMQAESLLGTEVVVPDTKPIAYLLPKKYILQYKRIPQFGETQLLPVTSWSLAPKFIFVSHKWASKHTPDDQLQTKASILKLFLRNLKQTDHIWIDYSCTPNMNRMLHEEVTVLHEIISKAIRVLVIPFTWFVPASPPTYDMRGYSRRAWCAFEYSVFLKRPSSVRIARISRTDFSYQLHLSTLPTNDPELGVSALEEGLSLFSQAVAARDKFRFVTAFDASTPGDLDLLWAAALNLRGLLFGAQRHSEDFFRRGRSGAGQTAVPPAPGVALSRLDSQEIYDEDTYALMNMLKKGQECGCDIQCTVS